MKVWISIIIAVACGAAAVQLIGTAGEYRSFLTAQTIAIASVADTLVMQDLGSRLPVPPNPNAAVNRDEGGHVLSGLGMTTYDNSLNDAAVVPVVFQSAVGRWAGQTTAVIDGDGAADCWSRYDVSMNLFAAGKTIHGSAGYMTIPARCSATLEGFEVLFDVQGKLDAGLLTLVLTNLSNRVEQLLFRGTAAGGTLRGSFFLLDGRLLSGPTVLKTQLPSDRLGR